MITKLGISSLLAGFFIALLSGISGFMEKKTMWSDLTLSAILGEDHTESFITWFDTEFIQNSLDSVFYTIPFFGILIGLGSILLVISLFMKTHK
ncbi:MAG: hypothetical protein ABIJ31_02315 [Pseudomonadota bacterium]